MGLVQVPYWARMGSRRIRPAQGSTPMARRGGDTMRGARQVVLGTLLAVLLAASTVRAATQSDACDPAGADGCPLAFNTDVRALLKQGTDLHTYRLDIPAAGRFLVTASPANGLSSD